MRIFELYQEPKGGSFTHDGKEYDLNKLLRLSDDLDVDQIPVDQLDWVLDHDDPENDPERIEKADLSATILVTWWFNEDGHSQLVVLDGLHRVAKADSEGILMLPGRYIDPEMLEQCEL